MYTIFVYCILYCILGAILRLVGVHGPVPMYTIFEMHVDPVHLTLQSLLIASKLLANFFIAGVLLTNVFKVPSLRNGGYLWIINQKFRNPFTENEPLRMQIYHLLYPWQSSSKVKLQPIRLNLLSEHEIFGNPHFHLAICHLAIMFLNSKMRFEEWIRKVTNYWKNDKT